MSEIDDIKRRAGIVTESVIHNRNHNDMSNPDVRVSGVGVYRLENLKDNVKNKIAELANFTANRNDDLSKWEQIGYMINHAAMQEMVKTIVAAEEELEGKDIERH